MLSHPLSQPTLSDGNYRDLLEQAVCFPWRKFDDGTELMLYAIFPEGHDRKASCPSVLFFHGGMWRAQLITEFVPWAMQLASRGIASLIPCYRTRPIYDVSFEDILDDAQECWLWTKGNAQELGLDPQRICVAGSDAGGLMALHIAMPSIPSKPWFSSRIPKLPEMPAAVCLFRGIVDIEGPEVERLYGHNKLADILYLNPWRRIHPYLPPLFASQGTHDPLLDWKICEEFSKLWGRKNISQFEFCDRVDHTYYHFNVNPGCFEQVYHQWNEFMIKEGIWRVEDSSSEIILT